MLTPTFMSRAPLTQCALSPLPVWSVLAADSLREKLIETRAGLLSRAASIAPHAGPNSAWFGGSIQPANDAEAMQAPDLLEAKLITAALLSDNELKTEALSLIGLVCRNQREDGDFGPQGISLRTKGRMLRAMRTAYSLCGEKEILTFLLRAIKHLLSVLRETELSAEDALHVADTLDVCVYLYNITGQKALLSLMELLIRQGTDYASVFSAFPYRTAVNSEDAPATANAEALCEGLRASALSGVVSGSGKQLHAPESGLARMNALHGAVCGGITGDPLLSGRHPSHAVTTASICELAASLETLLSCPDGEFAADQLETLMYNAVPAAFAPDGRGVLSSQRANELADGAFSCEDGSAICQLLSALPHFAQSQWLLTRDEGLCAMGYAPVVVRYRLAGASVRIRVSGDYPHGGDIKLSISLDKPAAFPLRLRIPAWANGASVTVAGQRIAAEAGKLLTVSREWTDGDEVLLRLPMSVRRVSGFHQAVCVMRGPVVFAAEPKETAPFGVILSAREPIEENGGELSACGVIAKDWGTRDGLCDQPPIPARLEGETVQVTLVPYSQAVRRLALLPQV